MNSRRSLRIFALVVVFLLTACSSTAPAAPTPLPTLAPFTHSSRPGDIASGDQLGLSPELAPICKECLRNYFPADLDYAAGLKELRNSTYPDALIPWFKYPPLGNFAFVNAAHTEFVDGFAVDLKDAQRQSAFDDTFIAQFPQLEQQTVSEWSANATQIQGLAVGDKSTGVASQPTVNGFAWRLDAVSFRVGAIGAFVFTLYPADAQAPIDIVKLAGIYADSLKQ